ncbi:MAG: M15 family metallopeptidase [Actinomycetota bacterium]
MQIDRRRTSKTRPFGRKGPNYTLRRLMALLVLVFVFVLVSRLISAVVSMFDSGGQRTPLTQVNGASSPSPSPSTVPPPSCAFGKRLAAYRGYDEWQLTLLDTRYRLPKSYVPPGLKRISEAGFKGSLFVRGELIEDLAAMRKAAAANDTPIDVAAAYRSFDQQSSLFERRMRELGREEALDKTARPGHSEHQLGTAVDFKTAGQPDVTEKWDQTPTGRWVVENAWRFGFVQSYPKGQEQLTCYGFEPWHYRYFGQTLAAKIHTSGLTLRQFLWNEQQVASSPIP